MKKIILIFELVISSISIYAQTGVSDVNFTPQSMLHVHINAASGNLLQLTNTTTGNGSNIVGFKLNYSGNDINFINNQAGFISFYTSNLERMRILSGGDVGIGITAPTHRLTIQSSTISTLRLIGPGGFGSTARLNFGDGNYVYIEEDADDYLTIYGSNRTAIMGGNVGIGVTNPAYKMEINGTFGFGDGTAGSYRSRTETRDDAGLMGTQSGFYQTSAPAPAADWPVGAASWWHLIDCRHSNNGNNYALQIAGSFFDQKLYFRKTNNVATQAWSEILTTANNGDFIQNQYAGPQAANYWISGESRTGSWFRNSSAGTGLYNEATVTGIYSPGWGVMSIYNNGSLGVGTTAPSSMFSVGGSSQFQVNSSGNAVRINDVPYSWPAAQGGAGSLLKNDGSGNLSWAGTNAQVISQVYTYNSSANICISGGWVDVTGCTATIPLIAGQKVVAWANGAAMSDNNCDGFSDAVYTNYNVRIAYDGADFTNGAWMRSNVDNQGSYHVFDNWAIVGEQDIATTGNHTFNLQGSWSSGSGNCIIGGNSSSALQAIMVIIVYQ
jgi:hypothetical protein